MVWSLPVISEVRVGIFSTNWQRLIDLTVKIACNSTQQNASNNNMTLRAHDSIIFTILCPNGNVDAPNVVACQDMLLTCFHEITRYQQHSSFMKDTLEDSNTVKYSNISAKASLLMSYRLAQNHSLFCPERVILGATSPELTQSFSSWRI